VSANAPAFLPPFGRARLESGTKKSDSTVILVSIMFLLRSIRAGDGFGAGLALRTPKDRIHS
jgi:hypothetical protein